MRKAAIIVAIVLFVSALCGCSQNSGEKKAEISFFALDTYISIQAEGEAAEEAVLAAREVVERSEDRWSVTDERSEVYAINHGAGLPRSISKDTSDLIAFSLQMAENTGGAFDPTIYPLVRAWGFTTGEYIPNANMLQVFHVGEDEAAYSEADVLTWLTDLGFTQE